MAERQPSKLAVRVRFPPSASSTLMQDDNSQLSPDKILDELSSFCRSVSSASLFDSYAGSGKKDIAVALPLLYTHEMSVEVCIKQIDEDNFLLYELGEALEFWSYEDVTQDPFLADQMKLFGVRLGEVGFEKTCSRKDLARQVFLFGIFLSRISILVEHKNN